MVIVGNLHNPRFKAAGRFGQAFLNGFGFAAIVAPWRTVYMLPEYYHHAALRRHEAAHLGQIDRDGFWYFWTHCLFWFVWFGHRHSPYEIEARKAETNPEHPLLRYYTC